METGIKVKTTEKHRYLTNDSKTKYIKSGEIVARDTQNKHRVLVKAECGCSEWFNVTDLKPFDAKCDH